MRSDIDFSIDRQTRVATIEIRRPPHNYFDAELIAAIADSLEQWGHDSAVRVILLRSEGKSFCAGANFSQPQTATPTPSRPHLYDEALRLFRTTKPIVAVVHGAAIGGGLGLALAADFRFACPEARFAANFVRIGFHPGFGLTATLPRAIGQGAAESMLLTGRDVFGEEAARIGLALECVARSELQSRALEFAIGLAEVGPLALVKTRQTMRRTLPEAVETALRIERQAQDELRGTADFLEGVRAIGERRKPTFSS